MFCIPATWHKSGYQTRDKEEFITGVGGHFEINRRVRREDVVDGGDTLLRIDEEPFQSAGNRFDGDRFSSCASGLAWFKRVRRGFRGQYDRKMMIKMSTVEYGFRIGCDRSSVYFASLVLAILPGE
ncbi:hypothetical protein KCP75_00805 [Salmonella enterica subsp. enterica]|nr:hypothetical protein KCP75_00805 [Salmonella enterica subsp. enterica]